MKIFITGASRGIGKNIMMNALAKGHDVAFTYCNPKTDVGAVSVSQTDCSATTVPCIPFGCAKLCPASLRQT